MFAAVKRQIILDEGVPVRVSNHAGATLLDTKALIGRATKQTQTEESTEYYRKGIFSPQFSIKNGLIVTNTVTGEVYLTLAGMSETYGQEKLSFISRMIITNAKLDVFGVSETADANGNIKKSNVQKAKDLPIHIIPFHSELKQYQMGLHEDAEFVIYAPALDFSLLDTISVKKGNRTTKLKIASVDYLSFDGVAVISALSETRK